MVFIDDPRVPLARLVRTVQQETGEILGSKERRVPMVQRENLVLREIRDGVDTRDRQEHLAKVEWLETKVTMESLESSEVK